MKKTSKDPGSANAEELAKYWRLPSVRAARELARKVGIRHVGGRYPWHAIWQAEGLAPPPRSRWDELKLPHCTADDVAGILGESTRSAQRRGLAKPDASFPDPIPLRKKPMIWRRAQATRLAGRIARASLQARLDDSDALARRYAAPAAEACLQLIRSMGRSAICCHRERLNDTPDEERKR